MSPYDVDTTALDAACVRRCPDCRALLPLSAFESTTYRGALRKFSTCNPCRTTRYTNMRRAKGLAARMAIADDMGLPSIRLCVSCQTDQPSHRFVKERGRKVMSRCMDCENDARKVASTRTVSGQRQAMDCYSHDFHSVAQQQLFPGVRYHDLTSTQRHQTYILARWRWLMTGWGPLFKRDVAQDKHDLLTWATAVGGPSLLTLLEPYDRSDPANRPPPGPTGRPRGSRSQPVDADHAGAPHDGAVSRRRPLPGRGPVGRDG